MNDKNERSESGAVIHRHTEVAPNSGSIAHADDTRLTEHYSKFLGGNSMVWHELISDRIHIDVHHYHPTEERPWHMLCTSGMSALPMNVPPDMEDADAWRHAELCIALSPDWNLSQEGFEDEQNYWPVRLIKTLARLPHDFSTWLGWGHTIPNGDPATPYAPGTLLDGAVLIPPFVMPREFFELQGDPLIHIFQVQPLTGPEMDFKLKVGLEEVLDCLESQGELAAPVDPARKSTV